jgi:hypothetical protein
MSQPPTPTGALTQPFPQPQPEPLPPPIHRGLRPKQFGWPAMIIAVVGAFGMGAAVVALGGTDIIGRPAATTTMTKTAPNDEPTAESAAEPTEPTGFTPTKSDFEVGIKILEKKCFRSGGCSITYRIQPTYVGTQELPDEGTIEVSYRVTGDESGPRQNTFEIVDGQTEFDTEEFAGTRSSGTVLKANVIEVGYTDN